MDGYVTIGTELDTKEFDAQMKYIERRMLDIEDKLKQADMGFEVGDTEKLESEYERLGNQLLGLKEKQEKYNESIREAQLAGFDKINNSVDGVGNSIERVTRRIGKMALAVFGIRSAFMFVRNSINTIANDDEQLKADIDYMKSALAYTLEPVVRRIVELAKQLMFYIGYIIKAWTGKDIFANANKGLKKATGGAKALNKELNKTLAGFDEMNVLQDSSSGGSGGGGGATPSFDLSNMEGDVPKWIKWIADNKDLVLSALAGIAAGLIAIKLGLTPLQGLGIGLAIAGIVYAIKGLIAYLKDPSFKNFGKIITGIGVAVAGVAIAIGAWPVAVGAAIVAVIGLIISNWEKIKAFLQSGIDWLTGKSGWIRDHLGEQIGAVYNNFVAGLQMMLNGLDNLFVGFKKTFDGIITFIKGVFTGNWKQAWEGVKQIFSGIFQSLSGIVQTVLGTIKATVGSVAMGTAQTIASIFKAIVNGVLSTIEKVLNTPIRTINSLISTVNKVPGIKLSKLTTFNLPRLAKGGIVNMPGRGIPVGSAVAGERGQEAVIPLTDSQQMALLGEAIGRYINLNATIPVYVGNRQIARELKKIDAENSFASNR